MVVISSGVPGVVFNLKYPLLSVIVPFFELASLTETLETGLPRLSVTLPVIWVFWAIQQQIIILEISKQINFLIRYFLVNKKMSYMIGDKQFYIIVVSFSGAIYWGIKTDAWSRKFWYWIIFGNYYFESLVSSMFTARCFGCITKRFIYYKPISIRPFFTGDMEFFPVLIKISPCLK